MVKLIAFDWNGTLLSDTLPSWRASNQVFKIYGEKPISLKKFRETFKIPIAEMWKANGITKEINFEEQSKIYLKKYEKLVTKARTRSGSRQLLKWLGAKRITRAIFSNHVTPNIVKHLIRLDIHQYFDEILARDAGNHSHMHNRFKDQKLFDYVAGKKLKPHEVMTVGDTDEEIEIGKKFGYITVALTGGYQPIHVLKKHKPDYVIHNLKDLIKIAKFLK